MKTTNAEACRSVPKRAVIATDASVDLRGDLARVERELGFTAEDCNGHPASLYGAGGETFYCDGSCAQYRLPSYGETGDVELDGARI